MKSLFKIIESTTRNLKTYSHAQHTASHQLKTTKTSYFDQSNCLTIYTTRTKTDWQNFTETFVIMVLGCYSKYILNHKIINTARQKLIYYNNVLIFSIWLAVDFQYSELNIYYFKFFLGLWKLREYLTRRKVPHTKIHNQTWTRQKWQKCQTLNLTQLFLLFFISLDSLNKPYKISAVLSILQSCFNYFLRVNPWDFQQN